MENYIIGILCNMENIGKRILIARKNKGLRQSDISDKLNITAGAVSAWENNINEPSVGNLSELAVFLDVSFEWLATGRGHMDFTEFAKQQSEEFKNNKNVIYLDLEDKDYLEKYRSLPDEWKEKVIELIDILRSKYGEKPKGSRKKEKT